jgi:exodeoxyribonuclease V gamma subunit
VISPIGKVELAPLTLDEAKGYLTDLLGAWHEGMRRPLPLAAKTGFDWLRGGNPFAARKTYEGAYMQTGEVQADPYLARAYPDFAALSASGEFGMLAERLLRPLFDAMHVANGTPARSNRPSADEAIS